MSEILNRKELMELLGYKDKDCFRKRLNYLLDYEQFPPHLPALPNKWSRTQVNAWIAGIRPSNANKINDKIKNNNKNTTTSLQSRLMARKLQIIEGGRLYN